LVDRRANRSRKARNLAQDENGWLTNSDPGAMLRFLGATASDRKLRLFATACCRLIWGFLIEPVSRQAVELAELAADGQVCRAEQVEAFHRADREAQGLHGIFICGGVDVPGSNFAAMAAAAALAPQLFFEYTDGGEESRRRYQPWECAALAVGQESRESTSYSFPPGDEDEHQPSDEWEERSEAAADAAWHAAYDASRKEQCLVLRDLFNPFHRSAMPPDCLTATVTELARAAYEERSLPPTDVDIPRRLSIPQIAERAWKRAWPAGHLVPSRLAVLADALEEAGCTDQAIFDHLRGPGPHTRGCWPVDLLLARE
jgi:hypothetical protein